MANKLQVKELRKSLGLSQVALADKSGVPQTTISAIEGGINPTYDNARKIAGALGVTMDDLLLKEKVK